MLELPEDKRPSLGTTHCMELCDIASESTIRSAGPLASILLPVHWTQTTPGMDCPICLQHITLQNEAYLNPCFHRFCFSCIQQWTESQQKHPAAGQACDDREFACPMCKRPYTHILYDCIGKSYRLLAVCEGPNKLLALPLSADQRRRRALYVTQRAELDSQAAEQAGRRAQPIAPSSPQTAMFLNRELQAILLEEDVDVIVQHVIGVLQNLANRQKQSRLKGDGISAVYGDIQTFLSSVAKAVEGFLEEHAAAFASQLWSFLDSGLNVAAYDALVFGEDAYNHTVTADSDD